MHKSLKLQNACRPTCLVLIITFHDVVLQKYQTAKYSKFPKFREGCVAEHLSYPLHDLWQIPLGLGRHPVLGQPACSLSEAAGCYKRRGQYFQSPTAQFQDPRWGLRARRRRSRGSPDPRRRPRAPAAGSGEEGPAAASGLRPPVLRRPVRADLQALPRFALPGDARGTLPTSARPGPAPERLLESGPAGRGHGTPPAPRQPSPRCSRARRPRAGDRPTPGPRRRSPASTLRTPCRSGVLSAPSSPAVRAASRTGGFMKSPERGSRPAQRRRLSPGRDCGAGRGQ